MTTPHRCIDPAGRVRVWWPEGHVTRYDDPQCPPKRQMREEVHAFRVPPGRPVLGLGTVVTERKATCHPPPEPKKPCDHPWCHCPGGRCVNEADDARFPAENR